MDGKFHSGVHILIKKSNKYLVLKRCKDDIDDPDYWELPGGGLNFGEQPYDAAKREVKEETTLDIELENVIALYGKNYHNIWSIESIIQAKYLSGEVIISSEHSEYKWVDKAGLAQIQPKSHSLVEIAFFYK